jgi:hypothetical protein
MSGCAYARRRGALNAPHEAPYAAGSARILGHAHEASSRIVANSVPDVGDSIR